MVNQDKAICMVFSMVGIVGVVGIIVLLMGSGSVSTGSQDITGQTISIGSCTETDGGMTDYTTVGTVTGTWSSSTGISSSWKDYCRSTTVLYEYYCKTNGYAYRVSRTCATFYGAGYTCSAGACVNTATTDSDSDGVYDSSDACPGYDDHLDTDTDGTADGCDTDDDGDGYSDTVETAAGSDPLSATSVPSSYPDLIITAATVRVYDNSTSSTNDIAYADITVTNSGSSSAVYSFVYVTITYTDTDGSVDTASNSYYVSSLSAGASTSVSVSLEGFSQSVTDSLLAGGSTYVSLTANGDNTGRVTESDETNNAYAGTYTLTSADVFT